NPPERYASTKRPIAHVVDLNGMSDALRAKLNAAIKLVRYQEVSSGTLGNRALVATDVDPTSGVDNRYGIYDRRQGYQGTSSNNGMKGAHHTVQIDFGKFKEFLNAPASDWVDRNDASRKVYWPDQSWSGILYVEFPLIPDTDSSVAARLVNDSTKQDKVRPALPPTYGSSTAAGYALVVRNAKSLPTMASNPSLRDDGFTLATNGPV